MLTPDERLRVDAVGMGFLHAYHRDSVNDVLRDLRNQRVGAVLLSTAMCQRANVTNMARMVREFPRVPAVALLSHMDRATVRTILSLGQCGVRTLIDVREPTGWRELRAILLRDQASDVQRIALSRLALDLAGCPEGCHRFFEMLFAAAAKTPTIRQLCRSIGVVPGTLMSRFFRSHLPPPKRFLAYARLTCAARLFENPGVSITSVANQLDYSSPQSFSRHVRSVLCMSAIEFRLRYDGEGMLECFRERLILPHRERWRSFDPLGRKQLLISGTYGSAAAEAAGTESRRSTLTSSPGGAASGFGE
ncbi:MAG: helix-turn-helix domain-containing protein [Gemmatimonadetes bacterium]|nr:helix-turn-helix domain-containing protein [Gemmatimonadota bacterium]MCC6769681.1 helix-turn-helix domain-containing protein [Gemmatimonadaceae bacterium]